MSLTYQSEVFELPCGYLDENHLLYSHVEVREMSGREEDLLSDRKKLKNGSSLGQVMANCCILIMQQDEKGTETRLEITPELTQKLTQADRFFILLKLRQVTHGDEYKFDLTCPNCEKRNAATIALSSLPIKKMPTPFQRHYDIEVPSMSSDGIDNVTFKITTGEDEIKMQKMLEQNPDKLASINLAARIVSVNGETIRPLQYLQALPARILDKIRAKTQEVEGGVDTKLHDMECVSCRSGIVVDLPLQESFFLPQSSR